MADTKNTFLQKEGLINPKPERVQYQLFESNDFFDPIDLPQVRYEMIRTARVENINVAETCRLFGFSREYFYKLERNFMARGFVALLGSQKGRRPLIALNNEIVNLIIHRKIDNPNLSGEDLRKEILKIHKLDCSRRTVERVIEKSGVGKKGQKLR
jgi:hypothetical protein